MKEILKNTIIAAIFGLAACSPDQKTGSTLKGTQNDHESILGSWTFNIVNSYQCNTCPTISFESDGKGVIKTTTEVSYSIEWKFSNDSILHINTIQNSSSKDLSPIIQSGDYNFNIKEQEGFLIFQLGTVSRPDQYVLKRHGKS
jgi:hypothetical protein